MKCELKGCTVEPEEMPPQQLESENQLALPTVAPSHASPGYTTPILLWLTTVPAAVFRWLVSMVIQCGHRVDCELYNCTVEPEEEMVQLKAEMQDNPALQVKKFSRKCGKRYDVEFGK